MGRRIHLPARRTGHRFIATITACALLLWATVTPALAVSGIRDAETEELLRSYANPIFRVAGLNPNQIPIYILNDPTFNAFVTPGNMMFINTGTLLKSERPLQIKGVIAHETGHIADNHVYRLQQSVAGATVPIVLSMLLGAAAAAAGAGDAGIATILGGQQIAERTLLKYSREHESAADQAAVTYLTETHQSARGLLEVTQKFRREETSYIRDADPFTRTHPIPTDRMAALKTRILSQPYADKSDTPEEMLRFKLVQAKLFAFLNRPEATFRQYPFHDESLPALYARAIAYYKYPDVDRSLALTDRLIAAEPQNPYFYEFAGQLLFENGRAEQSLDYLRKAVALKPRAGLIRIAYAQSLLATEDSGGRNGDLSRTDEAIKNLKLAAVDEQDNAFAWYLLATAYDRENNIAMANLATAERFYNLQDMGQSFKFAKQALGQLDKGTPQWIRAADIVQITAQAGAEQQLMKERRE